MILGLITQRSVVQIHPRNQPKSSNHIGQRLLCWPFVLCIPCSSVQNFPEFLCRSALDIWTAVIAHLASSILCRSLTASEQASISPAADQMSACIVRSRNKKSCRENRTCTLPRRRPPSFRRSDLWLPASVAEVSFLQ